jgi:hypothetical protein
MLMDNKILLVSTSKTGTYTELLTADYEFDKMELDLDSGRNLNGKMDRNILSHHPRKIIASFPPMDGEEMQSLLNLLDHSTLYVKAFDPFKNAMQTSPMEMMHGDLKPKLYWKVENINGTEIEVMYQKLQVELVEY